MTEIDRDISTNEALRRIQRFIDHRPRTSFEIRKKLEYLSYNDCVINEVTSYLKENSVINDDRFMRVYTDELIRKKYGYKRILTELSNKGVDKEILDKFKQNYPHETEIERAKEACRNKIIGERISDSTKEKKKIFDYLVRRGYKREIAEEAIKSLII